MEKRPLKRLKRFLRHYLLRAVFFAAGRLPLSWAMALGAASGHLAYVLAFGERRKALESLRVAYPSESEAWRHRVARAAFVHLGRCAGELCSLSRIDPMIDRWVELPDADRAVLDEAVGEGKGVVFVSGHVGNFELLARRIAMAGYPSQTIAKEASDPRTTDLIERMRASGRLKTIWRGRDGAARDMLRALKRGELLGLLIDQDTRVQGVFVDFFGKKAFTPRAAGDLAVRTGAAVVAGFIFRMPDGRHRISLTRVPVAQTDDRDGGALAVTQDLTRLIEEAIRNDPTGWVWMHQRWKTSP